MIIRTLAVTAVLLPSIAIAELSPYAGQQSRAIKALSQEEVDGLLRGKGMEMAKPAELNSYPGPRHALDLARELGLSAKQVEMLESIQADMSAHARRLGAEVVEAEEILDRLFAERTADPAKVDAAALKVAELQGRLRAVHLKAHLDTTAVLTRDQVRRYDVLRGYTAAPPTEGHGAGSAGGHGNH